MVAVTGTKLCAWANSRSRRSPLFTEKRAVAVGYGGETFDYQRRCQPDLEPNDILMTADLLAVLFLGQRSWLVTPTTANILSDNWRKEKLVSLEASAD
jgi:hypothetical protein